MVRLQIDPNSHQRLNSIWSLGGNTCHAPLWLRRDLQGHLRMTVRDLGFRYVRCHGILNDDMDVVRADGTFHFGRVIAALEAVRACGLRPFLELSSMPRAFASNDKRITEYEFRSAPPKDWKQWHALIHALTRALQAHFGQDELRQWYFEVWNEPDIAFWSGTQAEYFRLYDLSARAIKAVDPALRVGGPATARTNWIDEFLAHLTQPSPDYDLAVPRCDFISTHAYPSDLEFLDAAHGAVQLQNSTIMRELFAAVRRKVDAALGPDFPVICGEWNSSAGPLASNHDDANNGAFVVKTMIELSDLCQGSLYWNISDIYEECGFHYEPFHGGYGLITVNDLPKAAYHAFAFLHEHDGGTRLATRWTNAPPGLGALASQRDGTIRILLYHYVEPDTAPAPLPAKVWLDGLPAAPIEARAVQAGAGSAYETWVELGRPPFLNREIFDQLAHASAPLPVPATQPLVLPPASILQLTLRR